MNLIKTLLYGLVSGITEILPISSSGHQAVFRKILGDSEHLDMCNLFVHIGILLALMYSCKPLWDRMRAAGTRRSGKSAAANDRRIVKDATVPFVIVSLALIFLNSGRLSLLWVAALFVLNGVILFLPTCIATGNKDSRSMSVFDGILIGLFGALSVFPGLSRIGTMTSVISVRGAERNHGIVWAIALSIPALLLLIIGDIYFAITQGVSFYFSYFFHYLISFIGAFIGCCIAVRVVRRLTRMIGLSFFSYYCWGMAILTFALFLMI